MKMTTTLPAVERARRYLAVLPAAVSGERGHDATFRAAAAMVHGFALDENTAYALLASEHNPNCRPPWSAAELGHKVRDAAASVSTKPRGYILGDLIESPSTPLPGASPKWPQTNEQRRKQIVASGPDAAELCDLRDRKAALAAAEATMQPPVLTVENVTVENVTVENVTVENVTVERLAVLLSRLRETLTSLSPDAGEVVNNLLGRYNRAERTDETVYLKAWTGENCRVDRQGRDAIWLVRPWLSALWFVQPDKVSSLLAVESLKDGGFIQRLLLCHSGCRLRKLDEHGRTEGAGEFSGEAAVAWEGLVRELVTAFRKSEDVAKIVLPLKEASALYITHDNAMVNRWEQGELRDVTSFAVRWTEQAWRIGLCIHAGLNGKAAGSMPLEQDTARCAI
jgi:hypothetical protein